MRRALLATLALLVFPAAAQADFTVSDVERPTPVSAYAGRVVWSQYDASIAGYRLLEAHASPAGQVTTVLTVAPRSVPFDADVGPGADGAPTVVYSRCATEPRLGADQLPVWATGRGCDVYRFTLGACARRGWTASAPATRPSSCRASGATGSRSGASTSSGPARAASIRTSTSAAAGVASASPAGCGARPGCRGRRRSTWRASASA